MTSATIKLKKLYFVWNFQRKVPYLTHFSENGSVPYLEFQFLNRSNLSLAPGGIEIVYQSSLQRLVDLSKLKKLFHVAHLCIILTSSSIDSLERLQNLDFDFLPTEMIAVTFPKTTACISAPISIMSTENIFSISVLALTLPKPTEVSEESVK